ncbi:MAG TPA: DUF4440 domain-containing protein [Allosphingosinicella sp.]|nr:DUF4440 domain-containing protein [Allosphingosinicella sp.]
MISNILLLALAAAKPPAGEHAGGAAAVVEAERAFARHVGDHGFKRGFLAYAAPDAIMFEPRPANPRPRLEALPDSDPPGPPLQWWPQYAGIAASGDLGFTTGAASVPVRYFTVWRRQPDGGWKWIYDGGPPLKAKMKGGPNDRVTYLQPAGAAAGSAGRALAEIAPLEADLAALAARDAKAAHLKYLPDDALVGGSPEASFPGRAGQLAELGRRPAAATLRTLGGTASSAGDMAFTYGETRWTEAGEPRWGHYTRIWQKRRDGWRLVVDLLVPAPGAPPTAP